MKVNDLIETMAFTHRPQDGISVGVAVIAGVGYMSVSFVRTGDAFSRRLARRILAQRISSAVTHDRGATMLAITEGLHEKVDARGIVRELRKEFKPDPTCNDATFATIGKLGGVSVRSPMSRDESFKKIVSMFTTAVNAVATQCVS